MRTSLLLTSLACLFATPAAAQAQGDQPFRVFFDWGKPDLTRDAQAILDEAAAAYLRLQPNQVAVSGHTDRSGSSGHNLAASRHRAETVKAYLVAHGIPARTISVSAFGESQPVVPTEDGVREAQNRRVEIRFEGAASSSAIGAHSAMFILADGSRGGAVSLTETADKAWLATDVSGLAPGVHGIHVHAVGRCDVPDFTSAGPHWNPANRKHGLENPEGHHAGDLRNTVVGADGRFFKVIEIPTGSLDADGFALVIHASPDDNRTDPSGNSGARIACAAFTR